MSTEKKFNKIAHRINTIKDMVKDKTVDSIVDYDVEADIEVDENLASEDIRNLLPKKYLDFNKTIKELGGKLLYIKSGSTGHTFKGVHPEDSDNNSYAVKIVAYPKKENYGDLFNAKRPENAEILMIKILSYFVRNNQTPHIILPITTFNTSIKPFINLPKNNIVNNKRFDLFVKRYKKGDYYENVSVLISEWANSGDLLDYVKNNYQLCNLISSILPLTLYLCEGSNSDKINNYKKKHNQCLRICYENKENDNNSFKNFGEIKCNEYIRRISI